MFKCERCVVHVELAGKCTKVLVRIAGESNLISRVMSKSIGKRWPLKMWTELNRPNVELRWLQTVVLHNTGEFVDELSGCELQMETPSRMKIRSQ
jgi:hypothetical protein